MVHCICTGVQSWTKSIPPWKNGRQLVHSTKNPKITKEKREEIRKLQSTEERLANNARKRDREAERREKLSSEHKEFINNKGRKQKAERKNG